MFNPFTDNKAASDTTKYISAEVRLDAVVKSWRDSVFSFEWLDADGAIKPASDLSEREQNKRKAVEDALNSEQAITKPVLGIGLEDNVEIGSARAELLTLAAHGLESMPVHIRKSNESDFKSFLSDVDS